MLLVIVTDESEEGVQIARKEGIKFIAKSKDLDNMDLLVWVAPILLEGRHVAVITPDRREENLLMDLVEEAGASYILAKLIDPTRN